ncbi:MAG: 16S rRNA processing protein RimM [Ignavibacteria bacterium]|nr:16S rRNA processing protein RimM [Ignavibacteria bacterium]MCU7496731.1 16S rRNA processing protein RimM [Ignavibacteria bacterium]MCU7503086.1 16S rRNA processing protein RimM [Ignavibacteria bacterium]MCU7516494.1 16S rRNA processing protein RimM [Ignavibacteria bacterium]MCU7519259.1 16S rRNA processing protein RimM [Ignavibacteria bacterium]
MKIVSEYYLIAEIKSLFETGGFVNVIPYSDSPERLMKLNDVYIDVFGDKKKFSVEKVIHTGKVWSVKFKNFNSAREVEFLLGKRIFVDQDNLIGLEENTYFIHDLIGSRVFRNGGLIGNLVDVLSLPANDVYVIKDLSEGELLIPAVSDYVESFDPINKILVLRPGGDIFEEEDDED